MDPSAATVVLDRDAFNTFVTVWLALVCFVGYEWALIATPPEEKTAKSCAKHPGTDYCKCRGNLPPGKR